jgi:hypothetical protein
MVCHLARNLREALAETGPVVKVQRQRPGETMCYKLGVFATR